MFQNLITECKMKINANYCIILLIFFEVVDASKGTQIAFSEKKRKTLLLDMHCRNNSKVISLKIFITPNLDNDSYSKTHLKFYVLKYIYLQDVLKFRLSIVMGNIL